jgi:two-component system chemotaxis sensor kinase CheA
MLKKVSQEIQDISMDLRMTPIKSTFQRMTRIVRDTSALLGKNVQLNVVGEETKLDKTVLDKLTDPLTHLVRNSIDHGIESASERIQLGKPEVGRIDLKAYHQSGRLIIEVLDDGAGLNAQKLIQKGIEKGILESGANLSDEQAYELIFKPGFSTKNEVTEISGRGVGMDVVRTNFLELGGEIDIETKIGIGTLFRVTLPLTLAIIESLVVTYSGHKFVIPLAHISETLSGKDYPVQKATGLGPLINLRNENIKLFRLGDFFGIASQKPPEEMIIVIVRSGSEPFALMIDDIVVKMPVVVKQLTPDLAGLPAVSGTTILGDGHPALILELTDLPKRKIISGYRPSQMKSEVRTAI